jgi:hypothetical protein
MSVQGVYRKKKDSKVVGVPIMILPEKLYIQGTHDNTFVPYLFSIKKKEPWMKDYDKIVEKELMTWQ